MVSLLLSSRPLRLLLCLVAVLLLLVPSASGFNVYVPAKDEQCFFDTVFKGDKVVGSYWVSEGGNLDIDFRVLGPDNKVVYERERTQDGSFQFKAMQEGQTPTCTHVRAPGRRSVRSVLTERIDSLTSRLVCISPPYPPPVLFSLLLSQVSTLCASTTACRR